MQFKKSDFRKATYKQWNEVREFNGVLIAKVCWHDDPWKIVNNKNFDDICSWEYKPIASFHLQDELMNYLLNQ